MSHTLLVDWTSQVVLVVKNLPAKASRRKRLRFDPWVIPVGGGHGNPLQYSCLENPMDRGAWRAAVHRVTQNQTQLKWFSKHWLIISCISYFLLCKKTTPNLVSEHGKHSLAQFLWIRNLGTTWLGSSDSGSLIRFAGKGPLGLQASQGLNRIRFKQANSWAIGSSRLGSYDTVVVSLSTGLLAVQQVVSLKIKEVRQWQRKKARTQDISSSLFINLWNSTMSDVFCCMEVSHSSTHTQGEEKQSSL